MDSEEWLDGGIYCAAYNCGMRIGLLIYGSLETVSGGYLYDRKLVAYLRRQGVKVDIVSLPWVGYGRSLFHNFSPSLYRQLRGAPYDLLLQDELNHPSLFLLNRWLKRRVAYPIISIVHHLRVQEQWPAWQHAIYRAVERRYLDSVDGFVFNSETTRKTVFADSNPKGFQKPLGFPHVVAYPAGDRLQPAITAAEITARAKETPLRMLFVGNLIVRKGLRELIAALAQLEQDEWRLDVVGKAVSPRYAQQIEQQIKAANLTEKISLHGVLSDERLKTVYEQSHLLVVPSQYEGFGIVYLEGMGFGLPAIGSIHGAAHEIITHGVNGFLVDGEETAVFSQHLHTLIQNRPHLIKMSLAAQQRYSTHPTWDASMAKILTFLQLTIDN